MNYARARKAYLTLVNSNKRPQAPAPPREKRGALSQTQLTPPQTQFHAYSAHYICHRAKSRADFVKETMNAFTFTKSRADFVKALIVAFMLSSI